TSAWTAGDGIDRITATDGRSVVFGGGMGDIINIGSGDSVAFGDSGHVELVGSLPTIAYSTDTDKGGNDIINTGVGTGVAGDTIVVGGFGSDTITATAGRDIIFGDSAKLVFKIVTIAGVKNAVLQQGYSISPEFGGGDSIRAGAGRDIVVGG